MNKIKYFWGYSPRIGMAVRVPEDTVEDFKILHPKGKIFNDEKDLEDFLKKVG